MLCQAKKLLGRIIFLPLVMAVSVSHSEPLPKAIKMEPAIYPAEAKAIGASGKAVIKFEIDDSGRVESASVAKSSGSDVLDSAAIDAVMNYRFEKPNYQKNAARPTHTQVIDFNEGARNQQLGDGVAKTQYDVPPKLLETVPTVYPIEARRYHLEGMVNLALHINAEGKLERTKIVKSSGYNLLDEAALETVKSYKFAAASIKGKSVASVKDLKITFKLTPSDYELAEDKLASELNLCGERINNPVLRENISLLVKYFKVPEKIRKALDAMEEGINRELLRGFVEVPEFDALSPEQKGKILIRVSNNIVSKIRNDFSWEKAELIYIQSYCDTFTDKEVEEMLAFYKSPVGQSLLIKGTYLDAKTSSQARAIFSSYEKYVYDTVQSAVAEFEQETLKN